MDAKKWDKYKKHFLNWNAVQNRLATCPQVHALILLDKLFPNRSYLISDAYHELLRLAITWEELEKVASESQIIDLIRCGFSWSEKHSRPVIIIPNF
jgi:hypothetical protein